MKYIISILAVAFSSAAFAGDYVYSNDKIHFQSESTWVSVVSDNICQDGTNFYAMVSTCLKEEERRSGTECRKWGKKQAVQPMLSTKTVCLKWGDGEVRRNNCVQYGTVEYYQGPTKKVKFYEPIRGDHLVKTEMITVPSCN